MLTNQQLRKITYGALAVFLVFNAIFRVLSFDQTQVVLAAGCTSLFFIEK